MLSCACLSFVTSEFHGGKKAKEDPKMSKTKLKKLQKLEVRLLPYQLVPLFSLLLFDIYIYCWFCYAQEEKQKKLLQAKSIEILQYAPDLILYRTTHV